MDDWQLKIQAVQDYVNTIAESDERTAALLILDDLAAQDPTVLIQSQYMITLQAKDEQISALTAELAAMTTHEELIDALVSLIEVKIAIALGNSPPE